MPRGSHAWPTRDADQLAQGLSPSSWEDQRQRLLSGSAQGSPRLVRVDKLLTRVGVEVVEKLKKTCEKRYDKPEDKPRR